MFCDVLTWVVHRIEEKTRNDSPIKFHGPTHLQNFANFGYFLGKYFSAMAKSEFLKLESLSSFHRKYSVIKKW